MTDVRERLVAALADRYRIERELGQGGMATVYLAEDLKHRRKVALKVLKPELAAALGHDRFLREITTTANLRHPHILPLYDSGEAGDVLYYAMPFVEGESLRDRLTREKQLPVDDALQIAREVADALGYAHGRGVIHRDIKPENILLESGHAVVADFGIARAVRAAGDSSLTQAGMTIGTPAYMSPEQASGDQDLDARSDLYALGCVTYEMLAGQPPFSGPTAQSLIRQHLASEPHRVTQLRSTVPAPVSDAIQRALAKSPADRFASLSEFAAALHVDARSGPERVPRRNVRNMIAATGILAVIAVGWFTTRGSPSETTLDPDVIAVLPFRVGGNATAYLRESMLDLLNARLTGDPGPRIVEPRTMLAAWRGAAGNDSLDLSAEASRTLAATLGAGRVLLGSAIATPSELTLTGSLLRVADGEVTANGSVSGSADSVAVLVNRLVAQLLILDAGEAREQVAGLASTSLESLRDYLAGRAAYRRGDYMGAMDMYARALGRDSAFVQAAFGLVATNPFIGTVIRVDGLTTIPLVWRRRDRLSARDQALLLGMPFVGPNYPGPSTHAEIMAQLERAVAIAPDSPESWLTLGAVLSQFGAAGSAENWPARAAMALDRAVALDSSFAPAAAMRIWAELDLPGDSAVLRRLETLHERHVATGFMDATMLWASAKQRGDTAAARRWRGPAGETPINNVMKLVKIALHSAQFGLPLDDARWANETLARSGATPEIRQAAWLGERAVAFAEGKLQQDITLWGSYTEDWTVANLIQQALIEPAYVGLAERRAANLSEKSWLPLRHCFAELLRVRRGDTTTTRAAVRQLRAFAAQTPPPIPLVFWTQIDFRVCPLLLEAQLESGTRLDSLDALMRGGPLWFSAEAPPSVPSVVANWTIAKLRERQGDVRGALAAIRRRERSYYPAYLWSLPAFLREEGRLAALTGDSVGAVAAYERYLVLRTNPDPPFRPQRDSVVSELAALRPRADR